MVLHLGEKNNIAFAHVGFSPRASDEVDAFGGPRVKITVSGSAAR